MKFLEWFVEQHGPRHRPNDMTDAELMQAIHAGAMAKLKLEQRQLWDAKQTSALYAWNIRDTDKDLPR